MSRYNSMRLKGKCWPVVCLLLFLVSCGQKSKNNTQAVGVPLIPPGSFFRNMLKVSKCNM